MVMWGLSIKVSTKWREKTEKGCKDEIIPYWRKESKELAALSDIHPKC